jgi:hypothetical protein
MEKKRETRKLGCQEKANLPPAPLYNHGNEIFC